MKVGLYDLKDLNNRDLEVHQVYKKILTHNGIEIVRLWIDDEDFWDKVKGVSLFIMRFQHYDTSKQLARDILPVVEKELGIPCYPNLATAWAYDDKIKQYYLMKAHGFPMVKSWVFYDKRRASRWVRTASYPLVFKLRSGASSMNVILIETPKQAQILIDRMFGEGFHPQRSYVPGLVRFSHFNPFLETRHILGKMKRWIRGQEHQPFWDRQKQYVFFQKFLPGNEFDTRIIVISERAFGFRRMVRPGDFRASGSGLIDYNKANIDLRSVDLALKVSREMGFQSMAYDFIYNERGEPEFCEISYNYGWKVTGCPGYWDRDFNWHEGQFIPEYFHLIDGLGIPDLKMPQLNSLSRI
jgi:glutathione synthase/RimK-type ligase-like ATP-grasp enzyme